MKKILHTLGKFLSSKKGCLMVALVLGVMFMPHLAHAEDTGTDTITVKAVAEMLALLIKFLNALLWPFLIIIGELMDVDLIIGPGTEGRMILISNEIRSLVNIVFVLVLIFVALYNVLGIGGGEGELAIKTAVPKIALGLVLVNFTLPIGRVALDMANVGTNIAFGIPNLVGDYDFQNELENFEHKVCFKDYYYDSTTATTVTVDYLTTDTELPMQTSFLCEDTDDDKSYDSLKSVIKGSYFSDLNKNNLGLIMAVNMGKLGSLNILKEGTVSTFEDLTVSMIFATLMYLIYAISFIVLGILLYTRVFVLWLALALAPLAVLAYVVPQIKEWVGGAGDFQKKVTKHLISPIILGVTLSFGYLLMDAWNEVSAGSTNLFDTLSTNNTINAEFMISGVKNLPQLSIAIASVVVLWTGVFAAASDTYAQGITDGIKGFGENVKNFLVKLPASLPTVPLDVTGEGAQARVPAMGIKLWAESMMGRVSNGTYALEQMNDPKLKNASLFGIPLNGGNHENPNPEANKTELRALLRETHGQDLDYSKTEAMIKHFMAIANANGEPTKRDEVVREFRTFQQTRGGTKEQLVGIIKKYSAAQLGLKDESEKTQFVNELNLNGPRSIATGPAPAQAPAQAPAAPAPLAPAVVTSTNGVVGNADFQAARSGLDGAAAAAPASRDLVKGAADLKTAEEAVKRLATENTAEKVAEASKAVNEAMISVTKLQAMTSEPVIKANADKAMVELTKLKDQLPAQP